MRGTAWHCTARSSAVAQCRTITKGPRRGTAITISNTVFLGKSRSSITRHVACTVDSMRHFRQVKNGEMVSKNVLPPSSLSCLGCSNTWLYYIDPYNWSDSLWTSTRMVITLVLVFSLTSLILIFIKCCLCLRHTCC